MLLRRSKLKQKNGKPVVLQTFLPCLPGTMKARRQQASQAWKSKWAGGHIENIR